jgi:hypothetical protein
VKITLRLLVLSTFLVNPLLAALNPSSNEQTLQNIAGSLATAKPIWDIAGNAGTSSGAAGSSNPGVHFVGTTDAENLEVRLNSSAYTFFRFTQAGSFELINPSSNTCLGLSAGLGNTGVQNIAIGNNALAGSNSGDNNTVIGSAALLLNASGSNNTCIGYQTMSNDQSGSQNTAIGSQALSANISGTSITCIGYGADVAMDGLSNASAFGNGAIITGSNQIVLGNIFVTSIGGFANWTNFSDGQYKVAVQENVSGLAFIKKLRPITYQLDMDKLSNLIPISEKCHSEINQSKQMVKTGLIAQEVESAALEVGYDFDGVVKPQHEKDHYRLSYSSLVVPLIKAVQEQQMMIEELQKEIEILKKERY